MKIYALFIILILFGCTSSKVFVDYDKTIDFSEFKSFNFIENTKSGFNDLDIKRVKDALKNNLNLRNFEEKKDSDFLINFYAEVYTIENQNNIGIGVGTGGGRIGGGVSGGIPIRTKKDMIAFTVEFVDAMTNELFWQGVIETKIKKTQNPQEREEFLSLLVAKVLEKYPPKV